jgi:hypothetical protein
MPMKKKRNAMSNTSVRLSAHEKLCAERMEQLIKSIDELRIDVKDLRGDMNKGKGVIYFIIFIGTIVTAIASFFQFKN